MRHFTFNAFSNVGWLVLLMLFTAAAGTCIVLLYRYERRLVRRRLGLVLLTLRLSVVGAVFLTLLEPTLTWTVDRSHTGRVLIAVDVSDSMATVDRQADPSERLRWARGLGMIGNDASTTRLDRWQQAFDNGREPDWVDAEETQDPIARDELAEARRRQFDELLNLVGQLSRKEISRRLVDGGPEALQKRIAELATVELQVFAGRAALVDEAGFPRQVATPDAALESGGSDLIAGVTPLSTSDEIPLAGVVLFSDGRDTAAADRDQLLARLRALPVPVYPVLIGSQKRPRDASISDLEYPDMVYQNDVGALKANLRTPGLDGEQLTVTLEPLGRADAALTRTVTAKESGVQVEFPLDASQLGRQRYAVRIAPQTGETSEDNNEKQFVVNVVDDETHVLLLDNAARWEFRYLNDALSRDERVEVEQVVFDQPYLGILPDTFFPREMNFPERTATPAASPFADQDAIILGDVAPEDISDAAWAELDRFVRDHGGTLVFTAGKEHFPLGFASPLIERLLPIETPRRIEAPEAEQGGPPSLRGIHLAVTPEGARQEFLQFDADAEVNARIWDQLPGHAWGLVGRAKPAATVLATLHSNAGQRGLEFERENPIIVLQHAGAGQVLWIGIDSTWRWRHRVGDQYHHRFWGQLVRWAGRFKASAGNEHVRFRPDRAEIAFGEEAVLRARWNQRFLNEFPDLRARAEIFATDALEGSTPLMRIDLKPTETQSFIHEGRATNLKPGEYRVELKVEQADLGGEPVAAELFVTERSTSELAELAADRDLLQQIADATGGRLFLPDQVDQIPDLFSGVSEHESSHDAIALWDHWLVLAICCGLLTTEWVLRKLNGLP